MICLPGKKYSILLLFAAQSFFSLYAQKAGSVSKESLSDNALLNLTEKQTFEYFWEGAEPSSGMAPERIHLDNIYPDNDRRIIATGGSGFGCMAILAGIRRSYITRAQGL